MELRKCVVFIVLLSFLQILPGIQSSWALEDAEGLNAKNIVTEYYEALGNKDIASALRAISPHCSGIQPDGTIMNYDALVLYLKKAFESRSFFMLNWSITKSDVLDGKAIFEVQYNSRTINAVKNQDINSVKRRRVYLAKENGAWKITKFLYQD